MADTKLTRRDFKITYNAPTADTYKFIVTKFKGFVLEIEDIHFHHDSAVLLPDYTAADPPPAPDSEDRITSLAAIAACYDHAKKNPARKILIPGHTDTTGTAAYNIGLSQMRSDITLAILMGDRDGFVAIAMKKSKTEDYQLILKWVNRWQSWDCDPGKVDNTYGPKTHNAVKSFQKNYNLEYKGSIKEDGVVGHDTWGAFFDLYMEALREVTETDEAGLGALRANLKWVDDSKKTVGCGESWPIEASRQDNYRSRINRRVEILFFDPGQEPQLDCHASKGKCDPPQCEVYFTKMYTFTHIAVPPVELNEARILKLNKVDDHFAPGKENIDIEYELSGFATKKVTLEITSIHYSDNPIFTKELEPAEKSNGVHTFHWDGKANCAAGDLKDKFIHPLLSPYKVHVFFNDKFTGEKEFKVLYHSIAIRQGPWTPDEKDPDEAAAEKDWVQFKLNELGYFGGPVGKDSNDYLKKAVMRYKANHKKMHLEFIDNYTDTIDATLKDALRAGDNKREFLKGDAFADKSKEARVNVECITYERLSSGSDEFQSSVNRSTAEAARLNRPAIPVEVDIFLKSKSDAKTDSPEAVGPVRVNWKFIDPAEDLSRQVSETAAAPSKTKKFIAKCLKVNGGGAGGDNAHTDFGGIRTDAATYYKAPWFVDDSYIPYEIKDDAGQKTVFCRAFTDKDKFPKRVGKAGIYFRPSFIGGDDYRLTAEIDFTDETNKADLETFHKVTDVKSRLHIDTGTFRIWRTNRVALQLDWPKRANDYDWDKIQAEYARNFIDIDIAGISVKKIKEMLTEKEYKDIVVNRTAHKDRTKISLSDDGLCGVAIPAQGSDSPKDYKKHLKKFTKNNFFDLVSDDIRLTISKKVRAETPAGFMVLSFLGHKPVDIKSKFLFITTSTEKNYVSWLVSIGEADSYIWADQKDPDKVYYVVGHEMGHNFFLLHYENTSDAHPTDHDNDEHNCIMSYSTDSVPHQKPGIYTPHLCGKCAVKIRGWDIAAAAMPLDSK
jgi:hypothetical protein